jgi:twinkle protein
MIAEASIELVKAQMEITEVIGGFVTLKKHGANLTGKCPFHSEKTASFTVSKEKQIFKCFGCGKSGDTISFLIEHEKFSYLDAIKWLANKYSIELEEYQKREYVKPTPRLEKLGSKALEYFERERMISNNTLLRFNITEANEWMPGINKEVSAICFNYYRNGELVNIKFRGPQKSFKLAKDAELIFYNLDAIEGSHEAVIVEGEIDCLTMHECGVYHSVSVPNGAAKGNQKLEYLDNCFQHFAGKTKIILAVDNDDPGNNLRNELARRLGYERCYQVKYPEGCKDANDVLRKYGKDAVKQMIEGAIEWPIQGIVSMDEMYPAIRDYFETGYPKGFRAHIPDFDDYLTFYPGQLTVVTGIPGSGKSEFIDYLMASLTRFHGWSWGVCSFECPPEIHVTKLAEKFTNRSFAFRKDPNHRMTEQQFEYAIGMIDKYFHFVNLSIVDVTMEGLIKKAEEMVLRYGIRGFLFDPWNCIEHKSGEQSETKYTLTCLNMLINFLDKYQVHGFLVAHPTKLMKDKRTGKYEIPTLYNISGSAHFFNRTHNGISVYRDFQTNVVDVYVQKVKWSWLGKLGFASFYFDTMTRQYLPVSGSPPELGEGKWTPTEINFNNQ